MKIVKNLVEESKYSIKCPYEMKPTRIVVHNTANDATAQNEIAYMKRNNAHTSFHYAVDDKEVVQGILENRNGWHASDGSNGKGNREGIAIEICYSKSGGDEFIKAEQNAVELIVDILKRYGWGIDKVTKHQDYTNKYCPHRTLDMGWDRFLNMINEKLNPKKTETPKTETPKTETPKPQATTTSIKLGDKVKVNRGAKDYNGTIMASFIYDKTYTVDELKGDRAVLDKNGLCTAFNVKDLSLVGETAKNSATVTKPTAPQTTPTQNSKYYPKYNGDSNSIVDALKELGITSSFAYRKVIAKKNGIALYAGWASQNIKLLTLLKEGKLIKP